jgi:hypothetical protein
MGALPRRAAFAVFGLRLRGLADLLLALERRRIARPKPKSTPIFKPGLQQGFSTGGMGSGRYLGGKDHQYRMPVRSQRCDAESALRLHFFLKFIEKTISN